MTIKSKIGVKEGVKNLIRPAISYIPNYFKYGRTYRKYYNFLLESNGWTSEEKKEYQLKKIQNLVKYSYENIPYYKEKFDRENISSVIKNIEDYKNIPTISKNEIRKNFEKLKTRQKIKAREYNTGGSTGNPLKLLKSFEDNKKELAFLDYYLTSYGINPKKTLRKAMMRGPIPKKGIAEKIGARLILSSYKITEDNIEKYVEKLNNFNPDILHVYPSSIYLLSKLVNEKSLELKLTNLKVILSSSEVFPYEQIKYVENTIKRPIMDLYGNTEHTVLGILKEEKYHFDLLYGYTEVLDDEIISTGFNDLAMPLLRYKTGDEVVEYSDNTADKIKGRKQDYIICKDSKFSVVGIIFGQHFNAFSKLKEFQIYQDKVNEIILLIVENELLTTEDEDEIKIKLSKATNNQLIVKIKKVNKIERTKRGKYKFLDQRLKIG